MTIGERLRKARQSKHLSLQQVAHRIDLSSATLSRIETSKQSLDLEVFLTLARTLDLNAAELLDGNGEDRSLATTFASMSTIDRAKVWRDLTLASKTLRVARRYSRPQIRAMSVEIEELSAQVDLMRQAIDYLRRRLKNC